MTYLILLVFFFFDIHTTLTQESYSSGDIKISQI